MMSPLYLLGYPDPHTKEDWDRARLPEERARLAVIMEQIVRDKTAEELRRGLPIGSLIG